MPTTARLKIDQQSSILVETTTVPSEAKRFEEGVSTTGALDNLKQMAVDALVDLPDNTVDKISSTLVAFTKQMTDKFAKEFDDKNDVTISIEYGINLVGNLDVQLASTTAEAAIKVTVSWNSSKEPNTVEDD